jgi:hypothetical protein
VTWLRFLQRRKADDPVRASRNAAAPTPDLRLDSTAEATLGGMAPAELLFKAHARAVRADATAAGVLLSGLRGIGQRPHASIADRSWLSAALFDAHHAAVTVDDVAAAGLLDELRRLAVQGDATSEQRTQVAVALHHARNAAEQHGDERRAQAFEAEMALWQPPEQPPTLGPRS